MRAVRDQSGKRYLLLEESDESSLVRDPGTGERRYLETATLSPAEGELPLAVAARAVPTEAGGLRATVPDERALGLLVELDERGPLAVRELLGAYELCESDLHGRIAELRAAGLVVERDVAGERGYALTDEATAALVAARA